MTAQELLTQLQALETQIAPLVSVAGPEAGAIVLVAEGVTALAKDAATWFSELNFAGFIPDAQQQTIHDAHDNLAAHLDTEFSQPQWQQD
jgi:hypothetical protein